MFEDLETRKEIILRLCFCYYFCLVEVFEEMSYLFDEVSLMLLLLLLL